MGLLQDEWLLFEQRVLQGAGQIQRKEMEKAFFAGASITLMIIREFGSPEVSEEQGIKIFEAMLKEIQSFSDHQNRLAEEQLMKNPVGNG